MTSVRMLHRSAIGGCQGSGSLKICAPRASYAVACNQATRKNAPKLLTPTASGSAPCEPMKKDRRARDEAQCLAVSNPTADLSTHRGRKSVRTTRATSNNRDSAESLAMLLRMEGHEVTVVHDGP